ncbi:retrovirus-related pol polyprotein from transposon TNT 1-94 [Tanacetum coccineum]|uniref:Retrovirus-related pol polyprotein from transposon TNT 1-94 n=1 Tax=Tanacetum coccineum TaxID=301880 RepID=A0ABQ4X8L4_9ASTR
MRCNTCGSTVHSTTDHNDSDHFKRCEKIQASEKHIRDPIWYLDSGCSRSMIGVKSYLHKYVEQPGPKQVTIFNANNEIVLIAPRRNYVYVLDMSSLTPTGACLFAKASDSVNWLWHKRLSDLNFKNINKLAKQNKVLGLPSIVYSKDKPCSRCEQGKHKRALFKTKQNFSIRKCLHLLHMDLFRPTSPMSVDHEKYTLVIVDEYSRYTWVYFLRKKSHAAEMIMSFIRMVENQNDVKIIDFSYTPEQNSVAEGKNRTLIEAARTMLNGSDRWSKDQHIKLVNIIGDPGKDLLTRSMAAKLELPQLVNVMFGLTFLSEIEPKPRSERTKARECAVASHAGGLRHCSKWVFKNKKDEHGIVTKNKARLVVQGYSKKKGIDYDETCVPVARMEAIRIFLAFATYMNVIVFQKDVKSAFLNGKLKEVYVKQPPGFESSEFPDYVCKLDKALYGLKQAPRAWYETLSTFHIQNKFVRGRIDNTLFIYRSKGDVLLVQVYVDDIIFGSTSYKLCKQFEKLMTKKFEMSMMGELTYFLRLQIKQDDEGISIWPDLAGKPVNETLYRGKIRSLMYLTATRPDIQFSTVLCARYQSNPKESHLIDVKRIFRYLKGTPSIGLYYPKCSGFDLEGYSDSDYTRCNMDRKIISVEAEYVTAGCCVNILWMKSQFSGYGIHYKRVRIFYDNTSAIVISNNPVLHSRTKHIDIRYHFIRDHILKGDIELHFIPTEYQLADIFTKPLNEPTFTRLKAELEALTLDFKTFITSIGLDYNNGEYVAHPPPESVKAELANIVTNPNYLNKTSVLKNSFPVAWRILFTFVIQVDIGEIIYSDLVTDVSL